MQFGVATEICLVFLFILEIAKPEIIFRRLISKTSFFRFDRFRMLKDQKKPDVS